MTQEARLIALAELLGADYKTLKNTIGALSALTTTNKSSVVAAINEVLALANTGGASAIIDDAATSGTAKVWSIDKLKSHVAALKTELLGGVPAAAFDTLKEIADYIGSDATAMSGLITAVGNRVAFDQAQTLTSPQKVQARANIGALSTDEIGNPDADLVAAYNTAKA